MVNTTTLDLIEILENPFYLAEILHCATSNYEERNMNLFESYLIIPIIFNSELRTTFFKTNKTGRIHSLFKDKKYLLYSFENEVQYYKENIEQAIAILLNKTEILLNDENMELYSKKKYKCKLDKEYEKVIKNISKIFSKYRVEDIFNFLGVEKI